MNLLIICLSLVLGSLNRLVLEDGRTITVSVAATKDGQPLAGLPFILCTSIETVEGETDLNGLATAGVRAPAGNARIALVPAPRKKTAAEATQQAVARLHSLRVLARSATLHKYYEATVPTGTEIASIAVPTVSAFKASFVVTMNGGPVKVAIGTPPEISTFATGTEAGRRFVGGIAPNVPTQAYVIHSSGIVVRVPIPAIAQDTELPEVVIPPWAPAGTVRAMVTGDADLDSLGVSRAAGLTAVASDGTRVLSFAKCRPGDLVEYVQPGRMPGLPAGNYYLAPGLFTETPAQLRLIDRCLAGENLASTSIPRVTVVEGQEVTVTVPAVATEAAILEQPQGGT